MLKLSTLTVLRLRGDSVTVRVHSVIEEGTFGQLNP